ncbi:virulence factor TspB C-terminal domain-related protein, partial [Acinetobacter baumannii]
PYDAVASQVISDAVANKADGKAYVSSVADTALEQDEQKQIVPASDVANQLNNSQSIPTSNTAQGAATPKPIEGTPDPTQPQPTPYDITINFPIFCSWAPSVCQAAQVAINFPAKVDKWIEGLFYNTKGLPEYDNKTDLFIHEQPEIKHVSINWGSVCPAPVTVPLSFMGISREITVVNYQYICDYAWIIKASVNMVASISAVYIVAGRKE